MWGWNELVLEGKAFRYHVNGPLNKSVATGFKGSEISKKGLLLRYIYVPFSYPKNMLVLAKGIDLGELCLLG